MTILPLWSTVAGLNVPADSQVAPWGERMGVSDARRHSPKGRSAVCAAKAREAASNNTSRTILDFMELSPRRKVDGHTKAGAKRVCGCIMKRRKDLTQRTRRTQSSQRREKKERGKK